MKNLKFCEFSMVLVLILNAINVVGQNREMTEYYYISVDFYSAGQGIDQEAQQELFETINSTQKKFRAVLFYEIIRWGKEGEETVYIDVRNFSIEERIHFLQNLYTLFRDRDKMAIVHSNLYYEPAQQYLTLGISLYGQFEARENELLDYIKKWERRSSVRINPGDMINETAIPEDQDRRNQLNLSGLKKEDVDQILEKAKEIMQPVFPNTLRVDFIGIGGANDRAFKGYLEAFISRFEKENKVKFQYERKVYTMKNGGELFDIQLYGLNDDIKKKFVEGVNNLFAEVNYISLSYN